MVKASIEYHAPARYDDMLEVGIGIARIGTSSMRFVAGVFRGNEHLIGGELIYVNADPVTRRPIPVPTQLRELITAHSSP